MIHTSLSCTLSHVLAGRYFMIAAFWKARLWQSRFILKHLWISFGAFSLYLDGSPNVRLLVFFNMSQEIHCSCTFNSHLTFSLFGWGRRLMSVRTCYCETTLPFIGAFNSNLTMSLPTMDTYNSYSTISLSNLSCIHRTFCCRCVLAIVRRHCGRAVAGRAACD